MTTTTPTRTPASSRCDPAIEPPLGNAELVQLRVRVIALENLLIAMLSRTAGEHLELAGSMAGYISPRPGFTEHPVTLHAAAQITHLVRRAEKFASELSSGGDDDELPSMSRS